MSVILRGSRLVGEGCRWGGNLWHATIDAANTPKRLYYDCVKGAAVANKADLVGANQWWHDNVKNRLYLHSPDNPNNHQILVGFAWAPGSKDWYVLSVK